jgi:hypothetical protein
VPIRSKKENGKNEERELRSGRFEFPNKKICHIHLKKS